MKKRRSMSEINVVPYIDVMLVLLIIFMVTAPLLQQGVDVDLPNAPANPLDADSPEPIVVNSCCSVLPHCQLSSVRFG